MPYRVGDPVIHQAPDAQGIVTTHPATVFGYTEAGNLIIHWLNPDGTTIGTGVGGDRDHRVAENEVRPAQPEELPESHRPLPWDEVVRRSKEAWDAAAPPVPGDTDAENTAPAAPQT
jgi:hypothetical protein